MRVTYIIYQANNNTLTEQAHIKEIPILCALLDAPLKRLQHKLLSRYGKTG